MEYKEPEETVEEAKARAKAMNPITRMGYRGSVEYSEKDHCYFGQVLGIKSLISYEGATRRDLVDDFFTAVDDYLETCEANGIEPELDDHVITEQTKKTLIDLFDGNYMDFSIEIYVGTTRYFFEYYNPAYDPEDMYDEYYYSCEPRNVGKFDSIHDRTLDKPAMLIRLKSVLSDERARLEEAGYTRAEHGVLNDDGTWKTY